ncbi:hypothetical protein PVAP13_2KG348105 [Panicum virgatum]|uniref:Uncharacterized protein n=1 Tax=Panicum virgatum TaxID=38727 RepID=A0A8T0WCZ4_PANVG|nr:hypothetical protein PVAP13_2KG348105 [Panicum virgatum]
MRSSESPSLFKAMAPRHLSTSFARCSIDLLHPPIPAAPRRMRIADSDAADAERACLPVRPSAPAPCRRALLPGARHDVNLSHRQRSRSNAARKKSLEVWSCLDV